MASDIYQAYDTGAPAPPETTCFVETSEGLGAGEAGMSVQYDDDVEAVVACESRYTVADGFDV